MFNSTVLSLSVFSYGNQVNIRVRSLIALNGYTGTHIGIQIKSLSQQQVHGRMAGSNRGLQRSWTSATVLWIKTQKYNYKPRWVNNVHGCTFQSNFASVHWLFGFGRDHPFSSRSFDSSHISLLPLNGSLQVKDKITFPEGSIYFYQFSLQQGSHNSGRRPWNWCVYKGTGNIVDSEYQLNSVSSSLNVVTGKLSIRCEKQERITDISVYLLL